MTRVGVLTTLALLVQGASAAENPWSARVEDAVARATHGATVANLARGLDAAYRADAWEAAVRLAELAGETHPDAARLLGYRARALWRAGRLAEAEALADRVTVAVDTDPIALQMVIYAGLGRGQDARVQAAAAALARRDEQEAGSLLARAAAYQTGDDLAALLTVVEQLVEVADVADGYPLQYVAEEYTGVPAYLRRIGPQPVNQISRTGTAAMTRTPLIGLPRCQVYLNGHGPYDMILDTGGSVLLSVDRSVAEEAGLELMGAAAVRGLGGKDESQQSLVDELRIGEIELKRVVTRVFDVHQAVAYATSGIIGSGIFADGRLTMDFETATVRLEPSAGGRLEPSAGEAAGLGEPVELRVVGDAKLMTPIQAEGGPALALWDSGADGVYLSPHAMRRWFPEATLRPVDVGEMGLALGVGKEGGPKLFVGPGPDFTVGGREFKDLSGLGIDVLDTLFAPIIGVQCDVLIGMPLFGKMRTVTIDYPTRRMFVRWIDE